MFYINEKIVKDSSIVVSRVDKSIFTAHYDDPVSLGKFKLKDGTEKEVKITGIYTKSIPNYDYKFWITELNVDYEELSKASFAKIILQVSRRTSGEVTKSEICWKGNIFVNLRKSDRFDITDIFEETKALAYKHF